MLNIKSKLTVLHDANGVFTDFSKEAEDYQKDAFVVAVNKDTGYLYVGFDKPFNAFYVDFNIVNTNANTLQAEYFNTTWTALEISDDTKGFTRNGFIQWDRPVQLNVWNLTTINSLSKYWVRFRPTATHLSTTKINGLNIVYSDDSDLKEEFYNIDRLFPTGQTTFILAHVASRNQIIQELISNRFMKYDTTTFSYINLTPFDLLDIYEVRMASIYLTLSKILYDASDDPEGNLVFKAKRYEDMYKTMINKLAVAVDTNNDGIKDAFENKISISSVRTIR
jgi:hypothetical protein